jgi:hypothetical protein
VLVDLDTRLGCSAGQPAYEPSRLQDAVGRMEERRRVPAGERTGKVLAPLCDEAGVHECVVLLPQLVALLVVGRKPQASRVAERIAGESGERTQLRLRPAPDRGSRVGADRLDEHGVRGRAAPKREAPVAPTCTTGDLARLEQPDTLTRLGERERTRAARDPATYDRDVHGAVEHHARQRFGRLVEPERHGRHGEAILEARRLLDRPRPRA